MLPMTRCTKFEISNAPRSPDRYHCKQSQQTDRKSQAVDEDSLLNLIVVRHHHRERQFVHHTGSAVFREDMDFKLPPLGYAAEEVVVGQVERAHGCQAHGTIDSKISIRG
ncbi:hypothetical protein GW17_00039802 [Ensete ventricosum]|nr:hypothetical protein GW17_00039802 [Ensete ventricosum]